MASVAALAEEVVRIPAGAPVGNCYACGAPVYRVPRPSNVVMTVEVTADGDHHHPRANADGAGRAHLQHCTGRRR